MKDSEDSRAGRQHVEILLNLLGKAVTKHCPAGLLTGLHFQEGLGGNRLWGQQANGLGKWGEAWG